MRIIPRYIYPTIIWNIYIIYFSFLSHLPLDGIRVRGSDNRGVIKSISGRRTHIQIRLSGTRLRYFEKEKVFPPVWTRYPLLISFLNWSRQVDRGIPIASWIAAGENARLKLLAFEAKYMYNIKVCALRSRAAACQFSFLMPRKSFSAFSRLILITF